MNGLIDSVRAKLWDIVNELGRSNPTPNLRVTLYSYGHTSYDRNKGWVRKESDFTTDLDAIYQKLNGLTIRGGTEYVARVCRDALQEQKWSEDKNALKVIFVAGNEPASQDKEVKLETVAKLAKEMGVVINPIFCGPANHPESADWKEFAQMAGGKFTNIDMNRGATVVSAPQDKELADLSAKLNTTYVAYGKQAEQLKENQKAQDANAGKVAPGAAAQRAESKAGALYRNGHWDLVDKLKEDPKFDIKKVPEDELCTELKKLKPEEREQFVKDKLAEREKIQKQILDLSKQRGDYVREQQKKNPNPAEKAFEDAVKPLLREQAAQKGIKIPE